MEQIKHSSRNKPGKKGTKGERKYSNKLDNDDREFNLTEITGINKKLKLASKTNTKNYYKSPWETKIKSEDLTRLMFYQTLKNDFTPAHYIDLPNHTMRKIIAKTRCSTQPLEIEKGRHRKTAKEERWCNMCPDKVTEDEENFLTKCKSYVWSPENKTPNHHR